ncbi:DUF192 domain-containing protein [Candidatus Woesearchaeota archaeon]|nr:DUF192 domain-containing protein [Candidatus Woesearchaeota archaeon]
MKILNATKQHLLSENACQCRSLWAKARGLMFSREPRALIFPFTPERKVSFHMLFVFFPIDIIFLDRDKVVIELKENFRPFTFCTTKEKIAYAIEVPAGGIKQSGSSVGDQFTFSEEG